MKTPKRYVGMLPDYMNLKVTANNEEEAKEKLLRKLKEVLTADDIILWEDK